MDMINLKINGIPVTAPKGATVLDAAKEAGTKLIFSPFPYHTYTPKFLYIFLKF